MGGSDGIWDQVSSQEAVEIASRFPDPAVAARELASIARRRWHTETDGQLSDDITAVVVQLGGSADAVSPSSPSKPRGRIGSDLDRVTPVKQRMSRTQPGG